MALTPLANICRTASCLVPPEERSFGAKARAMPGYSRATFLEQLQGSALKFTVLPPPDSHDAAKVVFFCLQVGIGLVGGSAIKGVNEGVKDWLVDYLVVLVGLKTVRRGRARRLGYEVWGWSLKTAVIIGICEFIWIEYLQNTYSLPTIIWLCAMRFARRSFVPSFI